MFSVKLIKKLFGVFLFALCCIVVSIIFGHMTDSAFLHIQKSTQLDESTAIPVKIQRPPEFKENSHGRINVHEVCKEQTFEYKTTNMYEHGRLMKNGSLYYCRIPKCGTTFMGIFLAKVLTNETSDRNISYHTNIEEPIELPDVYSFSFVREPYGRLFAAWENKLFHPNKMWKKIGTDVIRVVRPKASPLSQRVGHDVSFRELVQYVVTLHEQRQPLNPHLTPMSSMCHPCKTHFDFIGRLETMTEDLEYLTDQLKYRGIVPNDIRPVVHIASETVYRRNFGRIRHMFDTANRHNGLLSRHKLFLRTWSSYQIRGIILKKFEMPFTEFEVGNVTYYRYRKAVKIAIDASLDFKEERKAQRQEALVQAYKTLPLDLMFKVRQFVKTDCNLYGYDDKPNALFVRDVIASADEYIYFKGY